MAGTNNSGSRPVRDRPVESETTDRDTTVDRGVTVDREVRADRATALDQDVTSTGERTGGRRFDSEQTSPTRVEAPQRTTGMADENADERARQRFGGVNWGAAFFGWLVAVGIATLLTAALSVAGAAIGLTEVSTDEAAGNAGTIGIVGGILLLAVLMIAYYAGGYVAGRMSRFDGGRQGIATWVIGLLVTIALAVAGAVLGSEFNLLAQVNLPSIPVGDGTLTTGGLIALAAIVLGTLLAAFLGGKAGTHYHRKVDAAGRL